MIKIAVFLEGHAELIFVRELLLKIFEFNLINVYCYILIDDDFQEVPYIHESHNAIFEFSLYIADNDNKVFSLLKNRANSQWLWTKGFHRVIALRDMYSEQYINAYNKKYPNIGANRKPDVDLNEKFVKATNELIDSEIDNNSERIFFCFAIMEMEAWLLALKQDFTSVDSQLTSEYIHEQLSIDLKNIDAETYLFHPAMSIEKIYKLAEKKYDKDQNEVNSLLSSLDKKDFHDLYAAPKCASFKKFANALFLWENICLLDKEAEGIFGILSDTDNSTEEISVLIGEKFTPQQIERLRLLLLPPSIL